jgi:hypothetical protein
MACPLSEEDMYIRNTKIQKSELKKNPKNNNKNARSYSRDARVVYKLQN